MKIFYPIALFIITSHCLIAQQYGKHKELDTVHVKGRSFIALGDSTLFVENDTILFLPDSLALRFKTDREVKNGNFYNDVKTAFYKRKFTKELYDVLFVDPDKLANKKVVQNPVKVVPDYRKFQGKTINKISIDKLEIFGTVERPNSSKLEKWAIKSGNNIHVYTKDRIVHSNIFFKEGDALDELMLTDSERVLRSLPYVRDARIYVSQSVEDDGVDVLIVIKDMWSIVPNFSYGSLNNYGIQLVEKNFLGYGHELSTEVVYNSIYSQQMGYYASYKVFNIHKSFINTELRYSNSQPINQLGIRFYRDFVTPETKYAGGLSIFRKDIELTRLLPDTTFVFRAEFNEQDVWFGKSVQLKTEETKARYNLQFAARFDRINYFERPIVTADTNRTFQNRNLRLLSIGLNKRGYEKSSLISGFGRTEDIPLGYLTELTLGHESNEFYNRNYFGGRFAIGQYYKQLGYFRPSINIGRFLHNGNTEQGVINAQLFYFSYLYRSRRYNFRQFLKLSYTKGINRYDNEYVTISNEKGVRDINYPLLRGSQKVALSAETVTFTPIYMLGFRFVFFGFIDLAMVNDKSPNLFKNTLYQGYGLGLRLHNENIAFNTIHLRFGWYPLVPPNNQHWNFNFSNRSNLHFLDFQTRKPEVVEFN